MKLILIRGLPGSGKSTVAKNFKDCKHLEADMFWGDNYDFDKARIREAHEWCNQKTLYYLNYMDVVVSNTFTTKNELRPYFEIAKSFGILPTVLTCHNSFGNVHNVPEDILELMKGRFEYDITELYEEFK
jgi:predicted kinase